MARLRFPGRPGQRIGKNYVKYVYDDLKLNTETCNPAHNKIEVGLKVFYDLFGYSDEEEDFDGFTSEDLAQAEAVLAIKLKQKQAIQRFLDSSNELSSPATSEIEKIFTSSDSDTSTSSVRRDRGMRNILRKSYDKMIKDGLGTSLNKSNLPSNNLRNEEVIHGVKPKHIPKQTTSSKTASCKPESPVEGVGIVNTLETKSNLQVDNRILSEPKVSEKKTIVKHLLEKAQHQVKTRRRRKRSMRPKVKKKFGNRFVYPSTCKYTNLRKRLPTIEVNESLKSKLRNNASKEKSETSKLDSICRNALSPDSGNSVNAHKDALKPKSKRSFPGHKRFVLPSISARSSRKIIPRKRYIDEYDLSSRKVLDEDSQCSRSSLSGSSETISAMDGGSSPDDSQLEDSRHSKKLQKKVGLLDRPLVIEGKRAWKPSLKVQMKLSQMNCEYPFALKKNVDDSSGTCTSSGSFKDIIKPDMVSKYAEKMAQKPKERPFKVLESFKRSIPQNIKSEPEKADGSSDDSDDGQKPEDKLEKVAAKIEKLLKSQWEGRLKDSSLRPTAKLPKVESAVATWKTEQQQRTSTHMRTKSIIRKARLQLKKRNLNLRTRKTNSNLSNSALESKGIKTEQTFPEKATNSLPVVSSKNVCSAALQNDVPSKSSACASNASGCEPTIVCVVCHYSKVFSQGEKLYEQMACEACSKFFDGFAKSPKQYFCTKDGDCSIDGSKESVSRKLVNSRCKACWLKNCMEKFTVSSVLREQLIKYVPRLDVPPHNPLIIVDDLDEPVETSESQVRGPRIKHVCRRAAVALGLPRATFSDATDLKETFNLSALPQEEKQKILETVPVEEKMTNVIETLSVAITSEAKPSTSVSKVSKPQVKKKSHKDFKVKNRVHLDLLKKSSLLIHKEQKRRKLLMKKSMKHLRKHSLKKSFKVGRKSEMKKTLKFSYKSAVKTSLKTSPKIVSKRPLRSGKFRKVRCKQCEGCLAEDCGECAYCLDKKKFGGPNLIKQACMYRRCLRPIMPASEKKGPKPSQQETSDKSKSFGGHSSFGGDGPSGIGLSLSSSSSPTSPDGSSCGSSCSSSSSSSSSGSSGSSSSSTSSRSSSSTSSSSSSDNITVPHSNAVGDSCANVSFMQSVVSEPVILQESECTDNNVVTNPIFQEPVFNGENYMTSSATTSLQELVSSSLVCDTQPKVHFNDHMMEGPMYKETGDTILYEDSSSIIELKNASYAPSLMYGASLDDQENSVSYSTNVGSKNQNSRQGSGGSRKTQYNKEQDQYGSAGSGDQESNGDEDEDDEDDEDCKKKKHYIFADYWEDYDFERISSQGFALISSQQIPLRCACFLCGSAGEEKLIFCVLCCEPYHTFCLPDDDVPHEENLENWCCKRCRCCAVCGLKHNLLKCKKCQCTYHAECLTPSYPTKPSRKKKVWMCPKCVKCKSCGTTSPASGSGLLWNFDLLLCQPCAKLTDKGNYCPVCHKCYEENDYESEMVECYKCNRWVHATCDNITDEGYEILSCLPETVVYTCFECTVEPTPLWKKAIKEYLKHGLKSVLNSLLTARCARHLVKQDEPSSDLIKMPNNLIKTNPLENSDADEKATIPEPQMGRNENDKQCFLFSEDVNDMNAEVEATVISLVNSVDSQSMLLSEENKNDKNISNFVENTRGERDEPLVINPQQDSEIHCNDVQSSTSDTTCEIGTDIPKQPDLLIVKSKLDDGEYTTIASFFEEVVEVLEAGKDMGEKHHTNDAKAVLINQTEKIFPWFKVPAARVWRPKIDLPQGMLPNAVIPPSLDHTYSHYMERATTFPPLNLKEEPPLPENRVCVLCSYSGDSMPKKCGRLLYCGQDDWIHVNCALWSAEVFQQQDGSLRNVYPAMSRGKLMNCEFCNQLGATVGCCVRGCPANYHFYCARKDEALLQEDRKVFCALHKDNVDERIVNENDYPVEQKVYVNQTSITPKWVKKHWEAPMDKDSLHIVIGSLTVNKLGHLTVLSTYGKILIPVNYECSRIFWSTKNPNMRVKYTCRVIEMPPDASSLLGGVLANTTTVHSIEASKYEENNNNLQLPLKTSISDCTQHFPEKGNTNTKVEHNQIDKKINYDVEKILHRMIKKITIKQKKDKWQLEENVIKHNSRDLGNNPGHNSASDGNSIFNNIMPGKHDVQLPRFNGSKKKHSDGLQKLLDCDNDLNLDDSIQRLENEHMNSDNFEGGDKSDYLDYYASLFKIDSDLSAMHNNKKELPFENPNQDFNRNCVKKYEFKKYRKRIKSASLTGNPDIDSAKIIQLLAEKQLSKDKYEFALKKCKEMSGISPKMKSLLNSVIPLHSVTETVLPVFGVGAKENTGITESSGYSSNDDSHFRQSGKPPSLSDQLNRRKGVPFEDVPLQPSSIFETSEESKRMDSACSWKKEIKFNGQNNPNPNQEILNPRNCGYSESKSESSVFNNLLIRKTYSKEKLVNGMCQTMNPFKCSKCKRIYRTNESFKKHSEACNFFVDSSSGDESDSSISSQNSDLSIASSSVKVIEESNVGQNVCQNQNANSLRLNEPCLNLPCHSKSLDVDQEAPNKKLHNSRNLNGLNSQSLKRKQESQNSTYLPANKNSLSFKNVTIPSNLAQSNNVSITQGDNYSQNKELTPRTLIPNETLVTQLQQIQRSPCVESNPWNSQRTEQNVPININNLSMVAENLPNTFNCGYGTTLCNNSTGGVMPMSCDTLIIPQTTNTISQPNTVINQIPVPQGNFLANPLELNPGSQLSYVGSITITNNETMSLAVNVPDQIVPIYPQQDLNFGVIPGPIQMHQPAEIHLSTMNVQHISVQSSFSASTLNQIVFPQQAMTFPNGQVMFVDNPISHHMSSAQAAPNYVLQVPVEQTQNCAFTTYVPQQGMQPQFVNQFAFQSNAQQMQSQQIQNVLCQQQNLVTQSVERHPQITELATPVNGGCISNPVNFISNNKVFNHSVGRTQKKQNHTSILPKPTQMSMSAISPSPPPPDLSNRSSPSSDRSSSSKSCVSAITVPPNSDIVDILKRAAERMLNMSAEITKKKAESKSSNGLPEKKTRFAHTRKVAARKAEKLKQKNAIMNGNVTSQVSQNKPKSVQFNIAALKPTFSIPFVPVPSPASSSKAPSPVSDIVQPPSPPSERLSDTPMPLLHPEVPMVDNDSDIYCYNNESEEDSPLLKIHMREMEKECKDSSPPRDKPYLMYEINSEDGFHVQSSSLREAWLKVYDELQDARVAARMKQITLAPEDVNGIHMMGLDNPALMYLLEQLPGAECCIEHDFLFHPPTKEVIEIPENATGCARSEPFNLRREYDMFNFLASEHRNRPVFVPPEEEEEGAQKSSRRANSLDLPIAMRFRFLKTVARETVGVYRSSIHGRGLFCKRNIDPGELVIEYAGEVIRSVLTDKRERVYQSKGIGCYMFRIDDDEVVDATMHGNAARFINHSCEPNCFSKVITVDGKKHIVIFALRRIIKGEELTYDYKFPFEDEKIPCHCNTRRCRKYLN